MGQRIVLPPADDTAITPRTVGGQQGPLDNYAFVMNISRLVGASSFTLVPGHEVRRASADEIAVIRQILQSRMSQFTPMIWEMKVTDKGTVEPLAEAEWQYHVIAFRGNNQILVEIEQACYLAPSELKIGFTIFHSFGGRGMVGHEGRLFQWLENLVWNFHFSEITSAEIETIKLIHKQLSEHNEKIVEVRRLIGQLQQFEAVPISSPLRFLGYFAILEALLTHPPKPTDPYDSITRQIKKKVTLLNHRSAEPLDYNAFGDADEEKVWTKMYTYRSALAHGGAPTFDEDLRVLGNHDNALKLLKNAVTLTIRQALGEPQLIADLKNC